MDEISNLVFHPILPLTLIYIAFEDENLGFSFKYIFLHSQVIILTEHGVAHSKFVKHNFFKFIESVILAF